MNDNESIDISDKYYKVRKIYDVANKNLKQFGFFDRDYSIDEMMIPYHGRHSAKQTMREKSVRFGFKNFCLASADGYPYHILPYCGAKGIGGTDGTDLCQRVVADLVCEMEHVKNFNLSFDNWYSSVKVLGMLNSMRIPTISTVRDDRNG